jgi:hypothetical protein
MTALFAVGLSGSRLDAQATTSVCKDGTTSATSGKGACSGHGGVDAKATAAAKKASSQIRCSDGTFSKGGQGACAGHGGIKTAAAANAKTTPPVARADDKDSTGAIAMCKDGMYSHQAKRQGACSKHGGVAKFLKA